MFTHCWWWITFRTIKDPSLVTFGYHLLLLATSHLVSDNRELMFQIYFEMFYSLLEENSFRTLQIYYWLPLATNSYPQQLCRYVVGHNRDLMFQAYFEVFYCLLDEDSFGTLKIHYQLPLVTNCFP